MEIRGVTRSRVTPSRSKKKGPRKGAIRTVALVGPAGHFWGLFWFAVWLGVTPSEDARYDRGEPTVVVFFASEVLQCGNLRPLPTTDLAENENCS